MSNKTYTPSIDNELENRLNAMTKYLDKNIKEIEQLMQFNEYLKLTDIKDYSTRFLLLGSKLLEFSKKLHSSKMIDV